MLQPVQAPAPVVQVSDLAVRAVQDVPVVPVARAHVRPVLVDSKIVVQLAQVVLAVPVVVAADSLVAPQVPVVARVLLAVPVASQVDQAQVAVARPQVPLVVPVVVLRAVASPSVQSVRSSTTCRRRR